MREIKFRAWLEGEMLSHEDLIYKYQETHAMYTIITNEKQDDDIVFMQYTGFKDKNGREIYDGDIYSYELYKVFVNGGNVEDSTSKGYDAVEFKDGAFYHGDELLADVIEYDGLIEYEGNIYEDAELIS